MAGRRYQKDTYKDKEMYDLKHELILCDLLENGQTLELFIQENKGQMKICKKETEMKNVIK